MRSIVTGAVCASFLLYAPSLLAAEPNQSAANKAPALPEIIQNKSTARPADAPQAGTVLAEIVPDELQVLVKARIMSEDIASIFPGQVAQVALSAYDVSRYGNLERSVQRIAPNTTQEENMPPFYETMISVPEAKLSKSNDEVDIVPGMTVVVDLIGKKRSVLDYIMTPLNRATGVVFREN